MALRERAADRGRRRGEHLLAALVDEARRARVAAGLSQADIGRAIGLSASRVSRIEGGRYATVPFVLVAQLLSVAGLELSARAFPAGGGLRDAGQLRLLERFRSRLVPRIDWRTEVPIPIPGDLRAWDAVLVVGGVRIGVDAETRLRDLQAVDRRIMLKARDSDVDRCILLVAATRSNRLVLREAGSALEGNYPVASAVALAELAAGRAPAGNALILL